MAPKKKFYAVARGYAPGIYDNWPAAEAQVKGFAGARFKGFFSRGEAEAWMKNPGAGPKPKPPAGSRGSRGGNADARRGNTPTTPKPGEITIYTDGGSINNPGPGGYGAVIVHDGEQRELSGGYRKTTNNRMELMACIVALREVSPRNKPITLYSDSSYVVNGITKKWAEGWRRRGWVKSDGKPAINPDLWADLLELTAELDVTFRWVKGHAGNPLNERCDELAVTTARTSGLPVDEGYEN